MRDGLRGECVDRDDFNHCVEIDVPSSGLRPPLPLAEGHRRCCPKELTISRRVLIIEDEVMIALSIEEALEEPGFEVAGTATRVDQALEMVESIAFDIAILDVNLALEKSFPVADLLASKGARFIFMTGYGPDGTEGRYDSVPVVFKPFQTADLATALVAAR
jgi:CheY-like chemotaxis protein